jgi:hypothetical protein
VIAAIRHYIAEVGPNAKPPIAILRQIGIVDFDFLLNFDRAARHLNRPFELGYEAVASTTAQATTMVHERPINGLVIGVQICRHRSPRRYEAQRTSHVSGKDGGQPAFQIQFLRYGILAKLRGQVYAPKSAETTALG